MQEEIYGRDILISVNAKEVYGSYMKRSERIAMFDTTSTTFIVDAIVEMQERDAISSYRNINFWSFQLRSLFITLSPISHLMSL